jgi:monoamine oxidase
MDHTARNPKQPLDIAVVGAGMAGLFAAWRLLGQRKELRLAVFEAGRRVGGRASTVCFPGEPGFDIDLGATMLMPQHRLLVNLLETLGIGTSPFVIATDRNVLHLRGKSIPYGSISRFAPRRLFPFAVSRRIQEKGPASLMRIAAERIAPGASKFGREDWNRAARELVYRGRPLGDWTAREVLSTVLTSEELVYLERAIGYSLMVDGPNAAEIFRLALGELSGGRSYLSPDGGFQRVAERLADRVRDRGGVIHCSHAVVGLAPADQGAVLSVAAGGAIREIAARKVILALPPEPLGALAVECGPVLAEKVAGLARRIEAWPMLVLAACYDNAWWQGLGLLRGHSVTDLPARQIWHFSRAARDGGAAQKGVAAIYCDGPAVGHWRNLLPALDAHEGFAALPYGHPTLTELHRQLIAVYGPAPRPEDPIGGFVQDWGAGAFGGAIHLWARGTDLARAGAAYEPAPGIYLCGEAWSNNHGWVEGALESAEELLQREFALTAWLA